MTEEKKICRKCVMPAHEPDITIDSEGVCNLCRTHENMKVFEEAQKPLESDFIKIINKYRGKYKYDCMVMCSGGKDSTSALYYMVRRFKLKPLAFTFDHGFETEEAMENIRNAVEILDVDFILYRSGYMKEMFSRILKTNSKAVICHPCSIWYMDLAFDVAARYEIPMIVAGWTKGQSTRQDVMSKCGCSIHAPEFRQMAVHTKEFLDKQIKDIPQYRNFPSSMEDVLARAKKRHKSIVVSPHWFLPFGPEVYVETIKNELGWKVPKISYPQGSTNCALNYISVHNSLKHYGYTHYHVELSKLIRQGVITRDEALSQLELNFDKDFLNSIAQKLDYKFE